MVGDGAGLGDSVGDGETVGLTVGETVGDGETVGLTVGDVLGDFVGVTVGDTLKSPVLPDEFTAAKIPVKRNKLAPAAKIVFFNINYSSLV